MLATTHNYPDAIAAKPAAVRAGIPILFTDKYTLPDDVKNMLETEDIDTVYILGGPAVIREAIEEELAQYDVNVIRVWGVTRYGTAAEIATAFWPDGSEAVILAEDKLGSARHRVATAARLYQIAVYARNNNLPLLLTDTNELSPEAENAIVNLGATTVYVTGNIKDEVIQALKDMDLNVVKLADVLPAPKTQDMVVVCARDYKDVLSTPTIADSNKVAVIKISSEKEIDDALKLAEEVGAKNVSIVGYKELVDIAAKEFENAGYNVTTHTGKLEKIAAKDVTRKIQQWREKRKEFIRRMEQKKAEIASIISTRISAVQEKIENFKEKIESGEVEVKPVVKSAVDKLETKLDVVLADLNNDQPLVALRKLKQIVATIKRYEWSHAKDKRAAVMAEVAPVRASTATTAAVEQIQESKLADYQSRAEDRLERAQEILQDCNMARAEEMYQKAKENLEKSYALLKQKNPTGAYRAAEIADKQAKLAFINASRCVKSTVKAQQVIATVRNKIIKRREVRAEVKELTTKPSCPMPRIMSPAWYARCKKAGGIVKYQRDANGCRTVPMCYMKEIDQEMSVITPEVEANVAQIQEKQKEVEEAAQEAQKEIQEQMQTIMQK